MPTIIRLGKFKKVYQETLAFAALSPHAGSEDAPRPTLFVELDGATVPCWVENVRVTFAADDRIHYDVRLRKAERSEAAHPAAAVSDAPELDACWARLALEEWPELGKEAIARVCRTMSVDEIQDLLDRAAHVIRTRDEANRIRSPLGFLKSVLRTGRCQVGPDYVKRRPPTAREEPAGEDLPPSP